MINVWGADHGGYIKRLSSAVKEITKNKANLIVKICQLVKSFVAWFGAHLQGSGWWRTR